MSNRMQFDFQNFLRNDTPLFLAITAWRIIAGSFVYIFANLGELKTIVFIEHINHSLVSATFVFTGILGVFHLLQSSKDGL